ncbi:MAG: Periplasmic thiol disulfide interchange protein DsbA, partial [Myxococcaceae bacterium]|nr:Periplasmic thiol disulfide interchange protein DsbA [Myxococcaceae bacterium]
FSDFQCPFCAQAEPVMRALRREYKVQIKLVWRDFPLPIHPHAELAAEAAREVLKQGKDEKFWSYHDLLFAHQGELSGADLERYAEQVGGLNMGRFRRALAARENAPRVQEDIAAYTGSGSHQGTPGFFVNGKLIEGAMPIEVFRSAINHELALK